jgi:hypothetical protein
MYRLMKSEKFTLDRLSQGVMSLYRQRLVEHFQLLPPALGACTRANEDGNPRFYVLNDSGQEYYGGHWID